jgi:hypothetical protein
MYIVRFMVLELHWDYSVLSRFNGHYFFETGRSSGVPRELLSTNFS